MQFEKYFELGKTAEAKQADIEAKTAAKRDAQVVAGGSSRQTGSTSAGEAGKKLSFLEAFALAEQQHGSPF
jgi:hypothetical protein